MDTLTTIMNEEISALRKQLAAIEKKLGINYTSDPNWIWLDGRLTALIWVSKLRD